MIVVGIDPGKTIGLCSYDSDAKRVVRCLSTQDPVEALYWVEEFNVADPIGIERARIYRMGGGDVANTIEQVGWFLASLQADLPQGNEAIIDCDGAYTVERRAVVAALGDVVGKTVLKDGGVWAALCDLHPDAMRAPVAGRPGKPAEPPRLRSGSKTQWTKGKPAVAAIEAVPAGPLYGVTSHCRAALAVAWTLARHLENSSTGK